MSVLTEALSEFDQEDVKALDAALGRFAGYRKGSGHPDFSSHFVAYTPVLSFALLKSQAAVAKLTRGLVRLTWVLAVLALLQIVTIVLLATR